MTVIKLMQSKRLSAGDLKNAKENKPNSFSNAEYSVLATVFGLSTSGGYEEFDTMTAPRVALPQEVQLELFDVGLESMLAFRHPPSHDTKSARDNFLTPVSLHGN